MINENSENKNQPIKPKKLPLIDEDGISSVRIELRTGNDDVLAHVSFSYYGMILSDIKIIKGKRRLFLKYPSRHQENRTKEYYMHPSNRAVNDIIEKVIFHEYDKARHEYLRKLGIELCEIDRISKS